MIHILTELTAAIFLLKTLTTVCNKKKEKTRLLKCLSSVLKLKLDINDIFNIDEMKALPSSCI